jgi:hypothetical protein
MRNGFRVCDVDTHINPGAEVLDKYVDAGFRPRLPELAPYKVAIQSREVGGERHVHRFDKKVNERTLGEAEPQKGRARGGSGAASCAPAPGSTTTPPTESMTWTSRAQTGISWGALR